MPARLLANLRRLVAAALILGVAAGAPVAEASTRLPTAAAIGATEAWRQATGANVVVAVIDSGLQFDHPALRGHLWTNPNEIDGNGVDDDSNGVVDDVHGLNVLDPSAPPADDSGHGTHVAGIVAGVAPDAQILPVKTLTKDNSGNWDSVETAVRYALAEGADIINLSIVSTESSPSLERAQAAAAAAGVPIVAAAGNNGQDIDRQPMFPAASPDPNVLGVGALDETEGLWVLSDRGPQSVELAAPGVDVRSPALGSGQDDFSGTSASAPHVSGALALLASARPDLPATQWTAALLAGARKHGLEGLVGGGALDVAAAMRILVPGAASPQHVRVRIGGARRLHAGRVTLRWRAEGRPAVARWRIRLDGRVVAEPRGRDAARIRLRIGPGPHRWAVTALNDDGAGLATATARFSAR